LYGPEFNPGYVGEEVDLFSLLSVGKVLIAGATVTLSPMIEPKKVRNGRNQNKNLIHS
jgi:hypothetical protein